MKTTISKQIIVNEMKKQYSLPKKYCENTVNNIFKHIANALNNGEDIAIPNFGKFKSVYKQEQSKKSPLTNNTHVIKSHRACRFQASLILKEKLKLKDIK